MATTQQMKPEFIYEDQRCRDGPVIRMYREATGYTEAECPIDHNMQGAWMADPDHFPAPPDEVPDAYRLQWLSVAINTDNPDLLRKALASFKRPLTLDKWGSLVDGDGVIIAPFVTFVLKSPAGASFLTGAMCEGRVRVVEEILGMVEKGEKITFRDGWSNLNFFSRAASTLQTKTVYNMCGCDAAKLRPVPDDEKNLDGRVLSAAVAAVDAKKFPVPEKIAFEHALIQVEGKSQEKLAILRAAAVRWGIELDARCSTRIDMMDATIEECIAALGARRAQLSELPPRCLTAEVCLVGVQNNTQPLVHELSNVPMGILEGPRGDEICLAALQNNWGAWRYVPEGMRTDEVMDIARHGQMLARPSSHGAYLRDVPADEITVELALAAVGNYGKALEFVPAGLLAGESGVTICDVAVAQNAYASRFVPEALRARVAGYVEDAPDADPKNTLERHQAGNRAL